MGYGGRRELRHCIWYGGFGYHARWASRDAMDVARALKALALFFRGVVVSDSDLNNHPAFQAVTRGEAGVAAEVIRDALDAGFIRRAPRGRLDDERRPWTQREVYAYFEQNNRELALRRVPAGHPERLDEILAVAEARHQPVIWSLRRVAAVFASRLRSEMHDSRYADPAQRDLAARVLAEAAAWPHARLHEFTAAKLLDEVSKRHAVAERMLKWAEREIGRSYNGNVAIELGESLPYASPPGCDDVCAPSGPGLTAAERLDAMQVYLDLLDLDPNVRDRRARVVVEGRVDDAAGVAVSLDALDALSFDAVEEIRETASPEALLDARFHAMQAPHCLEPGTVAEHEREYLASLSHHAKKVARRLDTIDVAGALGPPTFQRARIADAAGVSTYVAGASFRSGFGVLAFLDPEIVTAPALGAPTGLLHQGLLALRLRRCDARIVHDRARELEGGGIDIPGLTAQEEMRSLREAIHLLTQVFPKATDPLMQATLAGLDPTRVPLRDTVHDQWAQVVLAAVPDRSAPARRDALRDILRAALTASPDRADVRALCRRYGVG